MYDKRKFYQGEDIKFDFFIRDNRGEKINLDSFVDIILYIYNLADKHSTIRVSKVSRPGYFKLYKPDGQSSGNTYRAIIDSKFTKHLTPGQYQLEIHVVSNTNDLEDNRFSRIGESLAFKIARSVTRFEEDDPNDHHHGHHHHRHRYPEPPHHHHHHCKDDLDGNCQTHPCITNFDY